VRQQFIFLLFENLSPEAKSLLDLIDFELIFLSKNELFVVDLMYFKQIETAHIFIEPVC
jgi:hypothetical protein